LPFSSLVDNPVTYKIILIKTHPIVVKQIIVLLTLFTATIALAQSPEQIVKEAETSINNKIAEIYSLASEKQIYATMAKLEQLNDLLDREILWGTFDKTFRIAKAYNPSFNYHHKSDLPQQPQPSFWSEYEARYDKIMADEDLVLDRITSMVQLNRHDKVMAYGHQLKLMYNSITDAAENLGSSNLPQFTKDLYGNMNDFIENYQKIGQTELEGIAMEEQDK
jgi:hypothetical protein